MPIVMTINLTIQRCCDSLNIQMPQSWHKKNQIRPKSIQSCQELTKYKVNQEL